VDKELRNKSVLGANILKEGGDPPVRPDSEYPDWLLSLLDRPLALSELERRDPHSMTLPELHRFVKLDNRRRVKDNNSLKAKT
jgi:large subunit ribosomal protein L54